MELQIATSCRFYVAIDFVSVVMHFPMFSVLFIPNHSITDVHVIENLLKCFL